MKKKCMVILQIIVIKLIVISNQHDSKYAILSFPTKGPVTLSLT